MSLHQKLKTIVGVLCILVVLIPYPVAARDAVREAGSAVASAFSSEPLQAGVVTSPPPSRTISLADCFVRADQSNKEIITARWNLATAKAAIRIAGAVPNPQFQLQEGFGPSFTSLLTGQSEAIQWTQQIKTAGKRSKNIAVAKANYALAELELEALRFDVHNRVRRAYAEQAAAEAYAELIDAQRAVGQKLLAIASKRYEAGKAAYTEVLQAKLSVTQFDTSRNQAQIRLQQDSASLALLIGNTPEHIEVIDVDDNGLFRLNAEKTAIVPSPLRMPPPLDDLRSQAYLCRPDLKAARQQIYVNRKAVTLARSLKVPDLFVSGGYQYAHWARHQFPEINPVRTSIGNAGYITVTAQPPVLYQYQGEVRQALATLAQSERQVDLLRCQVATDVTTAYSEVLVARANIFLFQKNLLPTASEVARVARVGYQYGATDLATAIVAQQQYQQTLSAYFDTVVSYQTAWADLEKAVGVAVRL